MQNEAIAKDAPDQKPAAATTTKPPDNFSPINLDSRNLYQAYPGLSECRPNHVMLEEGDILYLPASRFQCVWSYRDEDNFHMDVKYWYQVPDQLDSFDQPYKDDFWAKQAARRS